MLAPFHFVSILGYDSCIKTISLCTIFLISCTLPSWDLKSTKLPYTEAGMAIGIDNTDTIWLIGGKSNPKGLINVDPNTNPPKPESVLTGLQFDVFNDGQYYSQSNLIVYMLMYDEINRRNFFNIYDLKQYTMTDNWNDMFLPLPTEYGACLATDDEYIYIIGGKDPNTGTIRNELQIYSRNTQIWASNPPSMSNTRYTPACIGTINTRFLYVM